MPLFESVADLTARTRNAFRKALGHFRKTKPRVRRGGLRRNSVRSERTGRMTRYSAMRRSSEPPAVSGTLRNAILHGRYSIENRQFQITESELVRWIRLERPSLTMILLVDLSRSTAVFRLVLADIIRSLRHSFHRNHDRIGLISMQGNQARVINHPSTNHRIVCRNLASLTIQGETPLGDGLMKALDMVRQEKLRKPGARAIVILLSDCFPEPLIGGLSDIFDEPAYRTAIRAAGIYRKRGVFLLVINPAFPDTQTASLNPGQRLSMRLVRESRGQLIRLATHRYASDGSNRLSNAHLDVQRIIRSVEEAFDRKLYQSGMQR